MSPVTLRVLGAATVLPAPEARCAAHAADPTCCACGAPIARPEDAALVTLRPPRLAHTTGDASCFVTALLLERPGLRAALARRLAEEPAEAAPASPDASSGGSPATAPAAA